ncbi:MAG TPA: hypothetical protein VK673_21980 [Chthoniobacterales bacterium]|nr:hypothetical protein [Chthoniobacterales bacterium]
MKFDREHFLTFASKLTIPSKEGQEDEDGGHTQLVPLIPIATQRYFLDRFEIGWKKGIRFFVVLKCRQSGMTTLGLAMDLYWSFMVKGLVHNFIGDTAKVTHYNRNLCRRFVHSLQKHPVWRYEIVDDNEDLMSFSNDSILNWHVANVRRGGGLGRSIGASAAHGTEVGGWEDEDGADSLMSSLAETSPNRVFLWEGTASGPGFFQDMCKGAARGTESTEMFIFIGWWLHPWYRMYPDRFEQHQQIYQIYWESNPVLSREELFWVDMVKRRYGFTIEPEQMAWWRWHLKQRKRGNLDMMYQEYPPIPEKAWQYGARSFFASNRLIERETIIVETRDDHKDYFRFQLKLGRDTTHFNDSDLVRVDPKENFYDIVMWDPPQPHHDLYRTVIGVDPIHGADEQSNEAAVQVFICYTDCYVQAAEFSSSGIPAFQLAWVVLHLAAIYGGNPLLCTELQGGGFELQNEIRRLQNGLAFGYSKVLEKAFSGLQHYRWTPLDRQHPGTGQSLHYKTTQESKEVMLEALKHYFERNMCLVRSPRLLKQMASCSWTKQGDLDVPRPSDLVMAAGFATMAYKQCLDTDIGGTNHTRAAWEKHLRESQGQTREEFLCNMLQNWADTRTLQVHQEELEMQELREAREGLADDRGWTRLNR